MRAVWRVLLTIWNCRMCCRRDMVISVGEKMKEGACIEVKNVSFRYEGTAKMALENVSFRLSPGRKYAVVGMNGSGKTTLVKLLCRLYDPDAGQILLNGEDIREYDQAEYLRQFSVVFQDFRLLALPLGENVAASGDYEADRVRICLEKAGFDRRLSRMENGLKTSLYKNIDKDGVEVSGGEAQKIALARALYKDAPIVILDEPTAALDPISEHEIYSGFQRLVGNKTAVFISHRLSSCRFCDEILVFHEGRLVQRGDHDALLSEADGVYSRMWHAQAKYYEDSTFTSDCTPFGSGLSATLACFPLTAFISDLLYPAFAHARESGKSIRI